MRFFFLMFVPFLSAEAVAQTDIEWDFDADLTIVAVPGGEDSGPEVRNGLTEISVSTDAEYLFQNGVELSGRLTFRAQTDHPARPGFAGALYDCDPALPYCPGVSGQGVRGAFSRVSTLGASEKTGARGSLEAAFIAIDGGWGEIVIGRDQGIGQRFYEGGPAVFSLARSSNPILDPFGTSLSRTKNDISSTAMKVSLTTPRILGIRAGLSYTPDSSVRRLDIDTSHTVVGVIEPELRETLEMGLQGSRYLRDADVRVRASLTWSQTQVEGPVYDDMDTISAGVDFERRDAFRFGVSYLRSTNGGLGDYSSVSAGGSVWIDDWELTLSGDRSEDETIDLSGWSTTVGASRELSENVSFSVGYRTGETDIIDGWTGRGSSIDRDGVLLEVRISN